jgi:hypothetical protein
MSISIPMNLIHKIGVLVEEKGIERSFVLNSLSKKKNKE